MKKSAFLFISAFILCLSCNQKKEVIIPSVYKRIDDSSFQWDQGMLKYNGKPFSGFQIQLFDNGDTLAKIPFKNGKENGWFREWHSNKNLAKERFYVNGKMEGEHRGWFENGNIRFIFHFQNDLYEGRCQEWFENGSLYREFNYKAGHESGLQKMWEPDGSIWANYEVKNGRKYGLSGVRSCTSKM